MKSTGTGAKDILKNVFISICVKEYRRISVQEYRKTSVQE